MGLLAKRLLRSGISNKTKDLSVRRNSAWCSSQGTMLSSYRRTMHVRKSECKHGHIFPPDDQCRWSTNWRGYSCRVCNECQRLRMQRKRESPTFREDSNARMRKSRANRGEKYLAEVRELRRTTKEWVD